MLSGVQSSAHVGKVTRGSAKSAVFTSARVPPRSDFIAQPQSASSNAVVCYAGKLGDVSLFGGDSMSALGGAPAEKAAPKLDLDEIPLKSTVGMDYTALRDHLKAGEFQKADDETRALLIRLAGEGAVKRNWVYWSEVSTISVDDFQTMDNLWKAASNGKFGFSVQKDLFATCKSRWPKFFKMIDWVQGEDNNYRKWPAEFKYDLSAPKGHLPLTNALRGTQLFTAIMTHPAWEKKGGAGGKSLDQIAREKNAAASKLF